ncbi:MAG: hypothetical protein J6F30_02540 [Cellulosilyticum sp.]|nr:hypothetical protein [Cellulosilyticum sp.]
MFEEEVEIIFPSEQESGKIKEELVHSWNNSEEFSPEMDLYESMGELLDLESPSLHSSLNGKTPNFTRLDSVV